MIVSGSDLFVTNQGSISFTSGSIGEYTTSGATVNATLVGSLFAPQELAISGSDLFVTLFFGNSIGEYTTSGATVNASLISGLSWPQGHRRAWDRTCLLPTPAPVPSENTPPPERR